MNVKRYAHMARMMLMKNGRVRAEYLRGKNIFKAFGNNCSWHSKLLPSEPFLIEIHNNVHISANVKFITHDIISDMFDNSPEFIKLLPEGRITYKWYTGSIIVYDNVMIGANSIILYGVEIGPNAIIAAGSVVVKNVAEGTIVGGNPAKVIGDIYDLAKKRALIS